MGGPPTVEEFVIEFALVLPTAVDVREVACGRSAAESRSAGRELASEALSPPASAGSRRRLRPPKAVPALADATRSRGNVRGVVPSFLLGGVVQSPRCRGARSTPGRPPRVVFRLRQPQPRERRPPYCRTVPRRRDAGLAHGEGGCRGRHASLGLPFAAAPIPRGGRGPAAVTAVRQLLPGTRSARPPRCASSSCSTRSAGRSRGARGCALPRNRGKARRRARRHPGRSHPAGLLRRRARRLPVRAGAAHRHGEWYTCWRSPECERGTSSRLARRVTGRPWGKSCRAPSTPGGRSVPATARHSG